MANPNKQSAPRPTDPLELMKQQGDDGRVAGTPMTAPQASAKEPVAEAPTVVLKPAEVPEAPKAPPPPAVVHPRFRVLEDRRVIIEQGRVTTWLHRGAEVSGESHDVESLRDQGVKLEPVGA